MNYPYLRRRDRGSDAGRAEIVFSEDQGYGEAWAFAAGMVDRLGLTVDRRIDGPDAWIWDLHGASGHFLFGYDDVPCETTLWAADPESDRPLEELFGAVVGQSPSSA
jgi:hypothetical protein